MSEMTINYTMLRCVITYVAASLLLNFVPSTASADGIRIPLEKFRRAEEVAVQRGETVANGACVINLINELRAYAGEPTGWFITFESETGVKFDSPAFPDFRHICIDGKQITFDHGAKMVVQIYDDNGNPQILEP